MLSMGETQQAVSESVGVAPSSISAFRRQALAKQIIERLQVDYILRAAKLCVNNQIHKMRRANQILRDYKRYPNEVLEKYKTILDLADKAEYRLGQITGTSPTRANNYVLNMLFADGRAQTDRQELEYLKDFLAWKRDKDIQEAEVIDAEATSEPDEDYS